jgi:hypothetical protein
MLADRLGRAARLDPALFQEVESDPTANADALGLVLVVAGASALGLFLAPILGGARGFPMRLFSGTMIEVVVGWIVWTVVSYQVSTRLLGIKASQDSLLRALAFAQTPTLILVLQFIPIVATVLRVGVALWVIAASFVAIRETLRLDPSRAAIVTTASFLGVVVVTALLGALGIGRGVRL